MGARFGIGKEDLEKLVKLNPEDFERKRWLALRYARMTAEARGDEPAGPLADEFRAAYTKKEQAHIRKILLMMKAANYSSNTLLHMPYDRKLSGGEDPGEKGGLAATGLSLAADLAFGLRSRLASATDRACIFCTDKLKDRPA